jgi:hypothetical protein
MIRAARGIGLRAGLFVAAMVTASLIAILFLGWRVVGLPFAPFDIFDWMTRVLAGRVIALGIGTMVAAIRPLHLGPTAETAKMAEQAMSIIALFVIGLVVGTHGRPDPIEQFGRFGRGQGGANHFAVFVAGLPSKRQEIDCNLQSNSR